MSEKFRGKQFVGKRKFTAKLIAGAIQAPARRPTVPARRPTARPSDNIEAHMVGRVAIGVALAVAIAAGFSLVFCGKKNGEERNDALSAYASSHIPHDDMRALVSKLYESAQNAPPDKHKAILPRQVEIKSLPDKDLELDSKKSELKTDLGAINARSSIGTFYEFSGENKQLYLNDEEILLPLSGTGTDKNKISCVDGLDRVDRCDLYLGVRYSFDGTSVKINDLRVTSLQGTVSQNIHANIDIDTTALRNSLEHLVGIYWRIGHGKDESQDMENKEEEYAKDLDRHKQPEFKAKLERSMLKIHTKMAEWDGGNATCSGWIAATDVIGTAKHCMMDKKTERMLVRADTIDTKGGQIAHCNAFYTPNSQSEYVTVFSNTSDLAAIVFGKKLFKEGDVLRTRSTPVSEKGKYFAAHFAGYEFPQLWKLDRGGVKKTSYPSPFGAITLEFDFSAQGGNSGGPIVDYNGDVVSLFAISDRPRLISGGPTITPPIFNSLVEEGRARLRKLHGPMPNP